MKSMKLAFLLCIALLIWATIRVQRCHAVSLDGGQITSFETIRAYNPGLSPAQVLQDVVADGNVLIYIGADWCKYCGMTMDAMKTICAEFPDVVFVYLSADQYRSFCTMTTIPELRLYKNGKLMQPPTGSKTVAALRALLNSVYKKSK